MTGLLWNAFTVVVCAFCLLTAVILMCLTVLVIVQFFVSLKKILKKRGENHNDKN